MPIRINVLQPVQGGPGLGLLSPSGNPYTVSTALGEELVNRGIATRLDPVTPQRTGVSYDPVLGALVDQSGRPIAGLRKGTRAPMPMLGGQTLASSGVTAVAGNPVITYEESGPDGIPAIKVVTGVGATAEIAFPDLVDSIAGGDAYLLARGDYSTNVLTVSHYVSQDAAGYAKGWVCSGTPYDPPLANQPQEQGGAVCWLFRRASNTPFGAPSYPARVAEHKIRITPRAGASATFWIYGFAYAGRRPFGRMAWCADDGYRSFMLLGWPSFESRGIPVTVGVIASAVDTPGYMSTEQLKALLDAGGACVAHGPWPNGGAGNLLTAYPNSKTVITDALDDMERHRDWLAVRGLLLPGAERCYIWPQGVFQRFPGDTALLDGARARGFTFGRTASPDSVGVNADARSRYGRQCLPIIGHTWGGTTAGEAANISTITARIDNLSVDRLDGIGMLHRVQPTATADGAMSSIGIRVADLETLLNSTASGVTAKTLACVTLPEMALTSEGFWQTA